MTKAKLALLIAAAKSIGWTPVRDYEEGFGLLIEGRQDVWNPFDDDADAFRIMVDASMFVDVSDCANKARACTQQSKGNWVYVVGNVDIYEATRYAIVEAAASLNY